MELAEIWRYPVKSMLGEQLDEATVGPGGIQGDRRWAVVDAESGVSLSAKRYADLLRCRAWTSGSDVLIRLPNNREYEAGSAEVARDLSVLLGRQVATRSVDTIKTIQHEFPTTSTTGEGKAVLYKPETEAFFDCAPLQLMTTSTLAELQRLLPSSAIHQTRFRPNFLLNTSQPGFIENTWVSKNVTLGSITCHVYDDTRRCIMVTLAQGNLPRDADVIRMILKHNAGRVGVALKTLNSGTVRIGMQVSSQ